MNPTLQDKRDAAAKLLDAATAIRNTASDAKRGMTPEEKTSFDKAIGEHDALNTQIDAEETEIRNKALDSRLAASAQPKTRIPVEQISLSVMDVEVSRSCRPLKAFRGDNAKKDAYCVGRWFMGLFNTQDIRSRQYAIDHGMEYRVATEGINSAGGALVPTQFENAVISLMEQYGTARQFCQVKTMTSDQLIVPMRTGGLTPYFVGENPSSGVTTSDKTWNNVNLVAKTLAVESRYSSNLSEDAIINVADDLSMEAALALVTREDSCLWNGDGTSTYGGIYGVRTKIVDGTHTVSAKDVATNTHNLFTEIDLTDLNGVMGALPAFAGMTPRWYCSQQFYHSVMVRLAMAAAGNNTLTMQNNLQKQFAGYPVVIDQTLPAGAATDYNNVAMCFFGDLSKAVVFGDRRGISVTVDPYSLSSFLQTKLVWSERFDIVAHSLGDTSTAGPIIGLIGSSS